MELTPRWRNSIRGSMANRTYEVMYIVDPDTAADKIKKLNDAVGKLITKEGGEVVRMDDVGMKPLAYPIQKKTEGHYVLFEIQGSGQEIAELERHARQRYDHALHYGPRRRGPKESSQAA